MVVLVIENSPLKLRGELTKWLMEVKPGTFAGKGQRVGAPKAVGTGLRNERRGWSRHAIQHEQ